MNALVLSRRNLICLLADLENGDNETFIVKPGGQFIYAQSDKLHYRDRSNWAGPVNEVHEKNIREIDACLALRRNLKGL